MENFSLDGVTATTLLDTRLKAKILRETDKLPDDLIFPVKYRVTYMRKQFYYPSGISMTEEEWKELPASRKKDMVENRELIISGYDKIKTIVKELVKGEGFDMTRFAKRLSRGRKDSLLTAFDNKIEDLENAGQIGTAITYKCAKNSVTNYTKKDLKLSDITIEWLRKYEANLINDEGKSIVTVKFYIGCIRVLMNEARTDGLITDGAYPFGKGKFEIKTGEGRKMALTLAQIGAVLKYPLKADIEKRSRDLWYFCYLTNGINVHDLCKLKFKNIAGGEIHWKRQKTIRTTKRQKEVVATLLPQMQSIIDKWGNTERKPDNYIFPFLKPGIDPKEEKKIVQNTTRSINQQMKKISDALKLDRISTYTARHSYATVLKRSGANIAFISESLGHSDLRTTENYLASFEQEERAKNASKLIPD